MTPAEIARKLDMIARLTADELRGWCSLGLSMRPAFDGERAALTARAKALGVLL